MVNHLSDVETFLLQQKYQTGFQVTCLIFESVLSTVLALKFNLFAAYCN